LHRKPVEKRKYIVETGKALCDVMFHGKFWRTLECLEKEEGGQWGF